LQSTFPGWARVAQRRRDAPGILRGIFVGARRDPGGDPDRLVPISGSPQPLAALAVAHTLLTVNRGPQAKTRQRLMAPTHILAAVDFGEMSGPAIASARELASAFGARLHVLHVAPNIVAAAIGVEGFTADFATVQGAIEHAARKQLDALVTDSDRRTLHAEAVLRSSNAPAEAIVDYARHAGIDLIVVGAHGSAITPHMLMGSIAERVVHTAPCPVLTVRPVAAAASTPERSVAITA
jgi:nucleotide-binding universal stress UspA family protein